MQNNIPQNKPNYLIHLIYACSFLLAVLSVICYMLWDKHQLAVQMKLASDQRVARENEHKINTINCMAQAANAYSVDWAKACNEQANSNKRALENCINEAASFVKYMKLSYTTESDTRNLYNLKVAQCKSLYSASNYKSDCMLPASMARGLNEGLKKFEKLCTEMS